MQLGIRRPVVYDLQLPQAPLLDRFNRNNEGPPPSGNWTNSVMEPGGGLVVSSRTAISNNASAAGFCVWNPRQFTQPCEVYVTFSTVATGSQETGELALAWSSLTSNNSNGYISYPGSGTFGSSIYRHDTVFQTQLGAAIAAGPQANGDKVLLRLVNGVLTHYVFTGGAWNSGDARSDATYTSGYLALGVAATVTTAACDDFGGGLI